MSWRAAFHEAGHAVAAAVLQLPFDVATIAPDSESHGRVTFVDMFGSLPSDAVLRAHIVASFAGPIAERRSGHGSPEPGADAGDLELIGELILRVASPDELDTLGPRLEQEAETLVADHWRAVSRVAKALIERKTLSAEEVAVLVLAAE